MLEICLSGLMSGIWKRSAHRTTAPDIDSTILGPISKIEGIRDVTGQFQRNVPGILIRVGNLGMSAEMSNCW
jgi:hypothetical protein